MDYFQPINENFVLFKMRKANLVLDKPLYIGFCVLEISKLHVYKLYYENFKKHYKNNIEMIYIDTDSLYMNIVNSKSMIDDFKKYFSHILDLSNYDKNHPLFSDENKGKLGFLKSETCLPIREFVGLRPKMYSFLYEKNDGKRVAKGVKRNVVDTFTHDMYKNVLQSETSLKHLQTFIRAKKCVITTNISNKTSLSCYYDKKFILSDGIHSYSYGHFLARNDDENSSS